MPAMAVDEHCDRAIVDVIQPPTEKRKADRSQVSDVGREVELGTEPWLYRVLVRRSHVDLMARQYRTRVSAHELINRPLFLRHARHLNRYGESQYGGGECRSRDCTARRQPAIPIEAPEPPTPVRRRSRRGRGFGDGRSDAAAQSCRRS